MTDLYPVPVLTTTDTDETLKIDELPVTSMKEAVFRVLVDEDRPLNNKGAYDALMSSQVPQQYKDAFAKAGKRGVVNMGSTLYQLSLYDNTVEKVARGVYAVHPDWNGEPLAKQTKRMVETRVDQPADEGDDVESVIPCYGIKWDRDLVSWEKTTGKILGQAFQDAGAVDFADQVGVYILYDGPNVVYVGRTAAGSKGLYTRLRSHVYYPRRAHRWTHFSWFGLRTVDKENPTLDGQRKDLDVNGEIMLMETLLIELLSPAFNQKGGDLLGDMYTQVTDPIIRAKERERMREDLKSMLPELMADYWRSKA